MVSVSFRGAVGRSVVRSCQSARGWAVWPTPSQRGTWLARLRSARFVQRRVSGRFGDDNRLGDDGRLDDVDRLAATLHAELHRACDQREERVVLAASDTVAGVEVRASLANDDLAGVDDLAAKALDAKELGIRVAPVARRRCTLFVCHVSACLRFWGLSDSGTTDEGGSGLDRGDLDLGRVLTVTLTFAVVGLVLELHDGDLGAFGGLDHLGGDLDLGELARVAGHG